MQNFSCNLTIDNLFYYRKTTGKNLLEIMKLKGHTKISFSKLTDIINYNENKEIQNIDYYKFDPKDKEMLDILDRILHLCDLYYC